MRPSVEHGVAPEIESLKPIRIKTIAKKVNHIHSFSVLYVKTVHSAVRIVGLHTLVEDDSADRIMLAFYNYYCDEKAQDVLPVGTYLAILAPYMRNSRDDPGANLMLRCDNPQCILQFETKEVWKAQKNFQPPPAEKLSPFSLREMGNQAFRKGAFPVAARFYHRALRHGSVSGDDAIACRSNLSEVFLRMEQWEDAEQSAIVAITLDSEHIKARFRLANALVRLNRPSEALELALGLADKEKKNKSFRDLVAQCQRNLQEQKGHYDINAIRRENKGLTKCLFHADFVSPFVELGIPIDIPGGRYRGCRATADLDAGSLIMASKAFVFVNRQERGMLLDFNSYTKQMSLNSDVEVVAAIIAILQHRLSTGKEFYNLSAGNDFQDPVLPNHLTKLDLPRIRAIIASNRFGIFDDHDELSFQVGRATKEQR